MQKTEKKLSMVSGSPAKSLIAFTIPLILGNLFQQFYNLIDSVVVGNYVGEGALAAVGGTCFSITAVFIAVATGAGVGCSVIISQLLGAERIADMKTAVLTALKSVFLLSLILAVVGAVFSPQILTLLRTPSDIYSDCLSYLRIYFFGLPFLFMYNVFASVFNALGDSRTPLMLLIFSSVLNVALDLLFVIKFNMAVPGVAWATLIAQAISAVCSFTILIRRLNRRYETDEEYIKFSVPLLKDMVRVAVPSIVQQSIISVGIMLVQGVVNSFGSSAVAGVAAANKIDQIVIMPMIAAGYAVSTFTAQNIGAGKADRVRAGYKTAVVMITVMAAVVLVVMQLFGEAFISVFLDESSSSEALRIGLETLKFLSYFYVMLGLKQTTDGVLRGSGDVGFFMLGNFCNLTERVLFAHIMCGTMGVGAVWIAVPIGWTINFLIAILRYSTGKWSKLNIITVNR